MILLLEQSNYELTYITQPYLASDAVKVETEADESGVGEQTANGSDVVDTW